MYHFHSSDRILPHISPILTMPYRSIPGSATETATAETAYIAVGTPPGTELKVMKRRREESPVDQSLVAGEKENGGGKRRQDGTISELGVETSAAKRSRTKPGSIGGGGGSGGAGSILRDAIANGIGRASTPLSMPSSRRPRAMGRESSSAGRKASEANLFSDSPSTSSLWV